MTDPTFSAVVPVYGNADTLPTLVERLVALSRTLPGPLELVFVVDGSPDDSADVLRRVLPTTPLPSQVLTHSRNFGSFAGIKAGLHAARGDYLGVIATDLQEPPELLGQFFEVLATGTADIVVGRREARADPAMTSALSRTFWWAYRKTINSEIPKGGVDVFGCTRVVAERLTSLDEAHTSLVGLLYWVGYRRAEVPYDRLPRPSGISGWTFRRKLRYLTDSVFSFTDIPIQLLTTVGFAGASLTLLASAVILGFWLVGRIDAPGYTPLMLAILFSTFAILAGLGVVGSYVWRTYENSKHRPTSIVMAHERFGPD
ncbi:MAG TPA: glycosyltransferase family 2 protein [Dermatophilaceae bacterium]|nr:glycosyltransferase family 2 protein [Dermatophilaceae bacterium]